ncbi:hypothetical protein HYFRA_00010915 [Hymenoscyphus fraxineus]|uniref:Uncharacterized protein n=1 Tax=Hymenoscyphus fraxineus TaxID=746836 RepID=A0A9N9KU52_9HELO|nr:hypothetical protein HYFRA_00010915 [Hymenoscyphus fraxineus]
MSFPPPYVELRDQWRNPGDILSLLLLIGGDIVQKATAQLVGVQFRPWKNGPAIGFTPIAFSFGWVTYAFTSLMNVVGGKRLMPDPDWPVLVVNCRNSYTRTNDSWVLGRLLRDHEARLDTIERHDAASRRREVSLRVDVYQLFRAVF